MNKKISRHRRRYSLIQEIIDRRGWKLRNFRNFYEFTIHEVLKLKKTFLALSIKSFKMWEWSWVRRWEWWMERNLWEFSLIKLAKYLNIYRLVLDGWSGFLTKSTKRRWRLHLSTTYVSLSSTKLSPSTIQLYEVKTFRSSWKWLTDNFIIFNHLLN